MHAAVRRDMVADGSVSVKAAAAHTGFGKDVFYDAMRDGSLSYVQSGGRKVIPWRALNEWLADRLVLR